MNIVHVICSLRTGGAEMLLIDIINVQAALGHRVSLIVTNHEVEKTLLTNLDNSVNIVLVNRPEGSKNPWWLMKYNLLLRRLRPDVVHFHHNAAAGMTLGLKSISLATAHTVNLPLNHYSKLRKVVAISDSVRDYVAARSDVPVSVILNGVACNKIKAATDVDKSNDTFRIVQVARLRHSVKGQDLLVGAVAKLREKGVDLSLDLIGEGPSRTELECMVNNLGLNDCVRFLGNCSREYIYEHLCDYDLSVLPSRVEGFGLSVAEAMAAKVPVLVSDLEGPLSVIDEGRYGLAFKSESVESLVAGIEKIMNDFPRYKSLADGEAYKFCVGKFGIDATVKAYLDEYEKIKRH